MAVARLQQVITIALLMLAAASVGIGWTTGHAAWGVVLALLLLCGHAAVLALEFVLLFVVHRGSSDPTPRAAPKRLLQAWAGETAAAPLVFCWRQPFRSRAWPDHLPRGARGRRGLLLVHGYLCNRGIWNPWLARLHAAGIPFVAVDLTPIFGSLDAHAAAIESAVHRLEAATGLAPVAVAHSMGGLALRRWWAEHGDERLHHAVTIATPHHGTWLARFATSPDARQMQHGGDWVKSLAGREKPSRAARCTCYYGHCDNIVFPPAVATLAGADNRHLAGVAHVRMVTRPEPLGHVLRLLGD